MSGGSELGYSLDNGDATRTTSVAVLNMFIWFDWILYILFGYLTLINYSVFVNAKTWTSYKGYNLAT